MISHDRLFKELLSTFLFPFLELFCPEVLVYTTYGLFELLDKETYSDIPHAQRREADLLAKVWRKPPDNIPFLILLEHMARSERTIDQDMFIYFSRAYQTYLLPIYVIVLFSHTHRQEYETMGLTIPFPDMYVVQFRYRVIYLKELFWRDYVNVRNPVACALLGLMNVREEEKVEAKIASLRLFISLELNDEQRRLVSGFIDTYLRLKSEQKEQFYAQMRQLPALEQEQTMQIITSWMQEGIEQGLEEGLQKGLKQGIEQGIEQGLKKGQLALVLRLLNRRCGELDEATQTHIQALSVEQLERLFEAGLDFAGRADLDAWLAKEPPTPNPVVLAL